jgi:uncharacterized protein YidB (DUF937 family)
MESQMNWINRIFDFFSLKFAPESTAQQRNETDEIADLLTAYFDENGGVSALVKRFETEGFAGKVRSWVSEGPSRAINSVEVLQLIGWKDLRRMSVKTGAPIDKLRDLLADALPNAIRRASRATIADKNRSSGS